MLTTSRTHGFSLVELVVVLAVAVLLMLAGAPPITLWIANSRTQNVAEQLQNSLRLAQSEALRRGCPTVFVLTNGNPELGSTPVDDGKNWFAVARPRLAGETVCAAALVQGSALGSQDRAAIDGPALLCFNSIGRQVSNSAPGLGGSATCTAAEQEYKVGPTDNTDDGKRRLSVKVSTAGRIRMCNRLKTQSSTNPDGC